jgi:hypothetical protein
MGKLVNGLFSLGRLIIAFFLCLAALLLPHRMRIWLGEAVGWIFQGIFLLFDRTIALLAGALSDRADDEKHDAKPRD